MLYASVIPSESGKVCQSCRKRLAEIKFWIGCDKTRQKNLCRFCLEQEQQRRPHLSVLSKVI